MISILFLMQNFEIFVTFTEKFPAKILIFGFIFLRKILGLAFHLQTR